MDSLLFTILIALAGGWLAGSMSARRTARRELENFQATVKDAAEEAAALVRTAAQPAPAPVAAPAPAPAPLPKPEPVAAAAPAPAPAAPVVEDINDEIIAVLTATVAAFLGKTARIRRVRHMPVLHEANPWAQQGRVFVQASHHLER